jgi:hypothetical protein
MTPNKSVKKPGVGPALVASFAILLLAAWPLRTSRAQSAQQQAPASMPGMNMDHPGNVQSATAEAQKGADMAMSGHDMEMSGHMFMTDLRKANAGDQARAAEIVAQLKPAIEKYKDYKVALAEGFKIFAPDVPQPHYHFTNYDYAREAFFKFDAAHPTSLLYTKTGDGYVLEGAMYTAPKRFTEDELNERVPLSVARWHEHVNLCFPPKGTPITAANMGEFGFLGSITTESACQQASGRWFPQIFNWMVHVYPYETDPAKVWAH